MKARSHLDCCQAPALERLRVLDESTHDLEAVMRCTACGSYWFYRFLEYVNWAGGDDDLTSWFAPLTEAEGTNLLEAADRSAMDLSFLTTRASWMDDNEGVRRVPGLPGYR
ncbi:hypothetical protein NLX83_05400 [Allokutzneria sp. A3M-2-11 16]|uniref:hypothetical protein n=1 Tax=Allokutzneria sp. A3M-2-11 16 TaxID=2962043 RepID=UPI0020B7B6C7|nr:hypothetical protein [Allokutzneria sp. A3M-2-11 16]MCP3798690.1 hypothetical protein [Allokutzneria sp. A3M-2-11 16]